MKELEAMISDWHLNALNCLSLIPSVTVQTSEGGCDTDFNNARSNPHMLPADLHCWESSRNTGMVTDESNSLTVSLFRMSMFC